MTTAGGSGGDLASGDSRDAGTAAGGSTGGRSGNVGASALSAGGSAPADGGDAGAVGLPDVGPVGGSAGASPTGAGGSGTSGDHDGGTPGGGTGGDYPTACPSQWWGSDVTGVKGTATCGDAYDRAQLVYCGMALEACDELSGPAKVSTDESGLTTCCYTHDETACGNPWVGDFCVTLEDYGAGTGTVDLASIASSDVSAACASQGVTISWSSRAEGISSLVGVWMRCDAQPDFPTPAYTPFFGPESDGVVFNPDGTFHGVTRAADGSLLRTPGCNQEGLWGFVGDQQLNVHTAEGENVMRPVFESSPSRLALDWMGVFHTSFARVQ